MSSDEDDSIGGRLEIAENDDNDGPLNLSLADGYKADVKQTLKYMIRARRMAEGKGDLQVEFPREETKCQVRLFEALQFVKMVQSSTKWTDACMSTEYRSCSNKI